MEFKDKLKQLRNDLGLSQEALAKELNISRSAVAKYESGLGYPSKEIIKDIATFFGIDESELKINKNNNSKKIALIMVISFISVILCGVVGVAIYLINDNKRAPILDAISVVKINNEKDIINETDDGYYLVNTYLDFELSFYGLKSNNKQVPYVGDVVSFADHPFANIYYQSNNDNCSYLIAFKNDGNYTLEYQVGGYKKELEFKVNNDSVSWDYIKYNSNQLIGWDSSSKDKVEKVEYDVMNISMGPGLWKTYSSTSKDNLDNSMKLLDYTFIKTNKKMIEPGMSKTTIRYITDSKTYSLYFYGNYLVKDSEYYLLSDRLIGVNETYEYIYHFTPITSVLHAYDLDGQEICQINNLFEIGFSPCNGNEELTVKYIIEGYGDEQIRVYTETLFNYKNNNYEIITTEDLSCIYSN